MAYSLVAVAGLAVLGRFHIRRRYSKLNWDDFFCGLAFLFILAGVIIPNEYDVNTRKYWVLQWVANVVIWTPLWLVKASFLSLCWIIFHVSPGFRKAWWVVAIYTAFSYWPVLLVHLWNCGNPSNVFTPAVCIIYHTDPSTRGHFLTTSIIEAAFHLSSELCILALPLFFIRQLQMSRSSKFSAAGIFGVIIIIITMGSLRTMAYVSNDAEFNSIVSQNISNIMQELETPLEVLVGALPPYKVLITKFQKRKEEAARKRQEAESTNKARAPPPPTGNIRRNVGVQDSITELEMA